MSTVISTIISSMTIIGIVDRVINRIIIYWKIAIAGVIWIIPSGVPRIIVVIAVAETKSKLNIYRRIVIIIIISIKWIVTRIIIYYYFTLIRVIIIL